MFRSFFYSSLLILVSLESSLSKEREIITSLLEDIKKNSLQLKISDNEKKSDLIINEKELLLFRTTGEIEGSYSNSETPLTSPFSSTSSRSYEYKLGVEKLWRNGLRSELSYTLADTVSAFASRDDFLFVSPRLELSLRSNIFQDLVHGRYKHLEERNSNDRELIKIKSKIERKNVLAKALLDFSLILEQKEELSLQRSLCRKNKVQADKLAQKRKRQSVSKRDYLLSLRELNACRATIELLDKALSEMKNDFESLNNVSFEKYQSINTNSLFLEIGRYYKNFNKNPKHRVNFEDKDEIESLKVQLRSLKERQKELNSLNKTDLSLEFRSGLTGLDESIGDAHRDITDARFPFVFVGLRMGLPYQNPEQKAEVGANLYRIKALDHQKNLSLRQTSHRFKTLQKTLEKDFSIYRKYKKSVSLSRSVLKEATRDFTNGRLDFFSVTEFNKSLIQDQRSLSSHRIQFIVRAVDFLDYYHFFDRFL